MKTSMFAILLSAFCVALPGRAGATQPTAATAPQTPAPSSPHAAWNTPQAMPLTRAQVYRELVHAERDGQLAQLDRELYSH
ncbi:DUF4148 domain-containing protein [Burkholderia sp. JP2-270]|uniref:DUF4148 domain-containing protein n=1 Tax=Burkholderia sp. JP2-270 TaxID=2217913 RepID=UPI000DA299BA|nr:DUF4148 domain-containing protein [Burkholderia sp. JP2-270]AWU99841.1 DUF4148 domain-containing protein [Burkholderia sp. JP2-270]